MGILSYEIPVRSGLGVWIWVCVWVDPWIGIELRLRERLHFDHSSRIDIAARIHVVLELFVLELFLVEFE